MSDQIKGEVLVPASRFIPKCDCRLPKTRIVFHDHGDSVIAEIKMWCAQCLTFYDQELPYGIDGIESGQAVI